MGTPSLVSPVDFADTMSRHWQDTLGNAPSDRLRSLWVTMATAFGSAIAATHAGTADKWTILNPPTGSGKSQGTCVYAAMVSRGNASDGLPAGAIDPVGILIVTRLISEAESLAETVNRLSGREDAAVARHSESRGVTSGQVKDADVLIVTHAAYVRALEDFEDGSRWSDLVTWKHGRRLLTVVDESLSNVVETHQLVAEDVRKVLGYMDRDLRQSFAPQTQAIETALRVLDQVADRAEKIAGKSGKAPESRVVWRSVNDGRIQFPESMSMGQLRAAMQGLPFDRRVLQKDSPIDRQRIASRVDETLRNVESCLSRWSYYAKVGSEHSFNSARLLIPKDLPAPVCLDATATQAVLWELLEDRAVIVPTPPGSRRYGNVTLHVARARGIGKTKMNENASTRIPRLLGDLQTRLGADRKVFLCCHMGVEPVALSFAPEFKEYGVAHWGAVDGRNDWQDFDTAVIFGLPYLDQTWATSTFFAVQGLQSNAWLRDPKWKSYADVRRSMMVKHLTTSVIQAINRVRCRRVIDGDGNCPATDVYALLPVGDEGDQILDNLRTEMPGIVVKDWDFELDGAQVRIRRGSSHDALLALMRGRLPGETSMSHVQATLGLSTSAKKDPHCAAR